VAGVGRAPGAARPNPQTTASLVGQDGPRRPCGLCAERPNRPARYFRLGEREAFILTLLDGQRDLAAIGRDTTARFGPLPDQAVEQFRVGTGAGGLLDQRASLWQRLTAPQRSGPLVVWTMRDAEGWLEDRYHRRSGPWFAMMGFGSLLFVLAIVMIISSWPQIRAQIRADVAFLAAKPQAIPVVLIACYLIMIPIVLSHEMAHAMTCINYDGRVSRFGLMIRHFLPAAFADVSDLYLLSKRARIAVYLSGPAMTLTWASVAVVVWAQPALDSYVHLIAGVVGLVAMINGLGGLIPVAGYDGSEALANGWGCRPAPPGAELLLGRLRRARSPPPRA